jgi:glutamate-1-semialdehyde 2,1-aminomutase
VQSVSRGLSSPASRPPISALVGGSLNEFALPDSFIIGAGAGAQVWDVNGKAYLDFLLGSGPMILGHAHPEVVEAVVSQVVRGFNYYALNEPAIELAAELTKLPGCVERVRFASTGTEAVMHAVRLARAATGREKIIVFRGSYHGSSDISIIGFRGRTPESGVPIGAAADVIICEFNDEDSVEKAFAEHGKELAALVLEPQQRLVEPTREFLASVRRLCTRDGVVLIFDEVLTGFRLAYGGCQEYYGVIPDVVCYGKIVGGGFPLSAVGGRTEIMDLAVSKVHVSGTMSGNPVAAVAGLATLRVLRRHGTYSRLHALGERLRAGLESSLERHGLVGEVIGRGPLAGIRWGAADRRQLRMLQDRLTRRALEEGILAQFRTRLYVSLSHTDALLDQAITSLDRVLSDASVGK